MEGEIYLVKICNGKVVPAIVLDLVEDNKIIVVQLKKGNYKNRKDANYNIKNNEVYIGKPNGLKDESVAMLYKVFTIDEKDIVKYIAKIKPKKVKEIISEHQRFLEKPKLHKMLHQVKKDIRIAQMNNLDYSKLQQQLYDILEKLGYGVAHGKRTGKSHAGYREAPIKGYIKIYYGGR